MHSRFILPQVVLFALWVLNAGASPVELRCQTSFGTGLCKKEVNCVNGITVDSACPGQAAADVKCCVVSPPPRALPAKRQVCLPCETDRLLFRTSLADFAAAKRTRQPAGLLWADNGCGGADWSRHVPERTGFFDFGLACARHDFGYANYKAQGRKSEAARRQIDDLFLKDMSAGCLKNIGRWGQCQAAAFVYYTAVRNFGDEYW